MDSWRSSGEPHGSCHLQTALSEGAVDVRGAELSPRGGEALSAAPQPDCMFWVSRAEMGPRLGHHMIKDAAQRKPHFRPSQKPS